MDLKISIEKYVAAWSDGDLNPSQAEAVVDAFCEENLSLTESDISKFCTELIRRGGDWLPHIFIAQVLLRKGKFDRSLMSPMLQVAIDIHNPDTCREFLVPCLISFGANDVLEWLVHRFTISDVAGRIGIANLVYHLHSYPVDPIEMRERLSAGKDVKQWLRSKEIDVSPLKDAIERAALVCDNLVELYFFYSLALPDRLQLFTNVPSNVNELTARIAGITRYECLLYNELGWSREF